MGKFNIKNISLYASNLVALFDVWDSTTLQNKASVYVEFKRNMSKWFQYSFIPREENMYPIKSIFILLMVSYLTFGDTTFYYESISLNELRNQYDFLSKYGVFADPECKKEVMANECGDYFESKFYWIEESFEHLPSNLTIGNLPAENYTLDRNSSSNEIALTFVRTMDSDYCDVILNLHDAKIRRKFAQFCTNILKIQSILYCMQKEICPFATVEICYTDLKDFHFMKNSENILEVFMKQERKASGNCYNGANLEIYEEKNFKLLEKFSSPVLMILAITFSVAIILVFICCISETAKTKRERFNWSTHYKRSKYRLIDQKSLQRNV